MTANESAPADETSVSAPPGGERRVVRTYCALCSVVCPSVITVEGDRVMSLEPDKEHPLGGAVCAKGRAAPEIRDHSDRANHPMRRTRPKGDPDPGWVRCTWDEALDLIGAKLLQVRAESGAHSVAFSKGTGGATGLRENEMWLARLVNCFGSPNVISTTHLCQWPRDTAVPRYTYGSVGFPYPDIENTGCVLLWGTNPSATNLSMAQRIVAAKERGATLVIVDPRRVGLANKADQHLRVRPGTDGALALSMIDVLIRERLYDEDFVRDWTNGPLLVRTDGPQRLLRVEDVDPAEIRMSAGTGYLAVGTDGALVPYDPSLGDYATSTAELAMRGSRHVRLRTGAVAQCRPVFDLLAELAGHHPPERAEAITGVPAREVIDTVRLMAATRPVAHYYFNGVVQHTNATQTCRAISLVHALLGDLDRRGGNVFGSGPLRTADVSARDALPREAAARRLGREERPLGPPGGSSVTAYDLYDAILEGRPYPVRALVTFANNLLLANGDTLRGRRALEKLEFFAVVELFHTPTSAYADVLLPAADFMESEALAIFRSGTARRRPQVVAALYERRSDVRIIFDLATRLGLGAEFWNGDVVAAYDHVLAPAGLTWEGLAAHPNGARVSSGPPRYLTYAEPDPATGRPRGFGSPTRKVELFSDTFASAGLPGLPVYEEPALSPASRPDLAHDYPLVLTTAKRPQYLHSQHRGLSKLRRLAPHPRAQLHPVTAGRHGVTDGDWIHVETRDGRARFRAEVTEAIIENVVCIEHGWWQACEDLGLSALDPYSESGSNPNIMLMNDLRDPVSGGTPFRSNLCRVVKVSAAASASPAP